MSWTEIQNDLSGWIGEVSNNKVIIINMMNIKESALGTAKTSFNKLSQGLLKTIVLTCSLTTLTALCATKITLNKATPCNKMMKMISHRKKFCHHLISFNVGSRLPMFHLLASSCEESTRSCSRGKPEKILNHLLLPRTMSPQLPVNSILNQPHPVCLECKSIH